MKKLLEDSDLGLDLSKKSDMITLRSLKKIAAIDTLNEFYDSIEGVNVDFAHKCLEKLLIEVNCNEKSLNNIPSQGAFILVANLPHGLLDGLLLMDTVIRKRPDAKIIGNFPLSQIEKISDLIIDVDSFASKQKSNIEGIKAAKKHLADGHPLIIFPANKVGTKKLNLDKSTQNEWDSANVKFIRQGGVPIIPTHISGSNSFMFELLSIMGKTIQLLRLGRELLNKEGYSYTIEIGKPIDNELHKKLININHLHDFLRTNIELLRLRDTRGAEEEKNNDQKQPEQVNKLIGLAQYIEEKKKDKKTIKEDNSLIFYAVKRTDEIEKWTTQVFESANMPAEEYIVGVNKESQQAVCMAEIRYGDKAMDEMGIEGLYTHNYFEYSHKYYNTIRQSIELGQRYVSPTIAVEDTQYRDKDKAISTMIWQSAIKLLEQSDNYINLIGTTSIREHYSNLSKSIIHNYIEISLRDKRLSKMAIARHSIPKTRKTIFNKETRRYLRDAELTNKLIADSDETERAIPSTLQYLTSRQIHILALSSNHKKRNRINALVLLENKHNVPRGTNIISW